jgi:aryl-alcohol dehydrogenase-like predicted oxidoreductase
VYTLLDTTVTGEYLQIDVRLFIPYFPLANGLLTGKYRQGQNSPAGSRLDSGRGESLLTERNLTIVEDLIGFSERRAHTILELAFSWLLARPAVASVIAGATSPEQIRSNAGAASWKLTDAELAEVDSIVTRSA